MAKSKKTNAIPANYSRLEGSERLPAKGARLLGPADPKETFSVTIIVRRRPDGPPLPDMHSPAAISGKSKMSDEDFAAKFGALPADIDKVTDFAKSHGLTVVETHAARRTVVVSGTVARMNKAFTVTLGRYEHQIVSHHGAAPQKETYRGREGFVHIPKELSGIIVGVFGLDNRTIAKHNTPDPPFTTTLSVPQVAALYNYPGNSAAGQTIGIVSLAGYDIHDVQLYFAGLPAGYSMPVVHDIIVHGSNSGTDPDGETTQDIGIAASFAPGATINVYISKGNQSGWVDLINRVAHPDAGDAPCAVLSSSFYISNGDDAATLTAEGISTAFVNAVSAAFQDAAMQGITVCIASGDTGSNSKVGADRPDPNNPGKTIKGDGKAHVQYPGSDPSVLSVGGTTIGHVNGSSFDEYVWNDPDPSDPAHWGTTGGGISDFFGVPSYQLNAGVPLSVNDHHAGRGVPDVAGNASFNSGYSGLFLNGNSMTGSGTSASAPQWAGLIAVINAAMGRNAGFINPVLYALGSGYFRDINPPPGPTDNGNGGITGYTAGAEWDACTGWGSPDGIKLLNGVIKKLFVQDLQFWMNKSTFGKDEVQDTLIYPNACWIVVDGFNLNALGNSVPALSGQFLTFPGVSVTPNNAGPDFELPGNQFTPQRVRFPFDIQFSADSLNAFPASGAAPLQELLTASITIQGTVFSAETVFELTSGADPYFTNIDPAQDNVFWLSQDLRVFTATPGMNKTPVAGAGAPQFQADNISGAFKYAQDLIGYLNNNYYNPGGTDPFNTIFPGQAGALSGDSSVTPFSLAPFPVLLYANYNFAIARVRLRGSSGVPGEAQNVKVFFRLFTTQSNDTDYQPATTYLSTQDANNLPATPLPAPGHETIPFFASDNAGSEDYTGNSINNRTIEINSGDTIWAYFGCFLNVYDPNNIINGLPVQQYLNGTHHCIVAQIAYDDAPIVNVNGVTKSPENSDKLAQRNLQFTLSDNPGPPSTHRIPQTFDLRPSQPLSTSQGALLNYPDELMIDWGNTPAGSTASIYWPQVNAADVLQLASQLYTTHLLSAFDANTIQCKTSEGVTYVPVPAGTGKNFAGLFTVDLPPTVVKGQELNIIVRRVTTRRNAGAAISYQPAEREATSSKGNVQRNWRYIVGTFQVKIPVSTKETMLFPEQNTLAIMKWRLQKMSPVNRWYPVLKRYVSYIAARVDGLGGNAASVQPSLSGMPVRTCGKNEYEKPCEYHGKVSGIIYDRFGDFEGFFLRTDEEEHRFYSREHEMENLSKCAWKERMAVTVMAECHEAHIPVSIILRYVPHSFQY